MRRVFPPSTDPIADFERMLKEGLGLDLLADKLGGATRAQALKMHRKLQQVGRTPCRFLDDELGIARDARGRAR